MSTAVLAGNDFVIDEAKHAEAKQILEDTRDCRSIVFSIDLENGKRREIPAGLSQIFETMLQVAATGGKMSLMALPTEMTTSAAASLLGISRPTLVKLIKQGALKSHQVGSHARILTSDLLDFQEARAKKQRDAFEELRRLSNQLEDF